MERFLSVMQVIAPIFTAVFLGVLARRKKLMEPGDLGGLQQFVVRFALPCVVFNSCLTAKMGTEALLSMALVLPGLILGSLWAFGPGKRRFPHHNLPMLFSAHETGMLGIPLTITLFGAAEAYRMGVLDLAQALTAFPVIAILTADTGENPTVGQILKKVAASPLMIMSALGLILNLSGAAAALERAGVLSVITESAGFVAGPTSALMLFSVGYNFSLDRECWDTVARIAGRFLAVSAASAALALAAFRLVSGVEPQTVWVMLLYCVMPSSFLAPGLGKTDEDARIASGVCSVLTAAGLACFCAIAAALG